MKRKSIFAKIDKPLFFSVTLLVIFGILMIYSASSVSTILRYNTETWIFFGKQLFYVCVMYFIAFPIITRFPTNKYAIFRFPLLIIGIFSLIGLFLFAGITNDTRSWYNFPFFSLQPSEFMKSILIITGAIYYNMLNKDRKASMRNYLLIFGYGILATFLIAAQPDLGSAIITGGISFMIFISVPYIVKRKKVVFLSIALIGIVGLLSFNTIKDKVLTETQLSRFDYKNPCDKKQGSGYQVCNGFIAINNGGLIGEGFGNSTQKYLYLPESHTDFIYPIIIEEVGYIAGITVLILYIIILWRILKIAREAHNLRCSILAYGTFWFIALHIIVNLYGILALFPLTGVPLPFLSYGGSSIANVLLMTFITLRVSIENKEETAKKILKKL